MVREIVHIQVGQCGNQIGNAFWSSLGPEHCLESDGKLTNKLIPSDSQLRLDKIGVYYDQDAGNMKYSPRACLIDLEPGIMDVIRMSPMGALFKPDNMCFGASGAGNNWAKGHYTEGAELIDEAMDSIRRETEICDCPQGFQMTHSLGGGTGSGMGTLILLKIRDQYIEQMDTTHSVLPSPKVSDVVVEPYNATLAFHQLLENSDFTFIIDNESLFSISHNVLKQQEPKYADFNWVSNMATNSVTSSWRFDCNLNCDFRKMATNLVPFPRLLFLTLSQSPLYAPGQFVNLSVEEMTKELWSGSHLLQNTKWEDSKILSASCAYRGAIDHDEVDGEMRKHVQEMQDEFTWYTPDNLKLSVLPVPLTGATSSATLLANTTGTRGVFQRIAAQFDKMFKRRSFLHWYKGEGMEEEEFVEARNDVGDLITEYQDKESAVWCSEEDTDIDDEYESSECTEEEDTDDDIWDPNEITSQLIACIEKRMNISIF